MSLPRDRRTAAQKVQRACYLDPLELLLYETDSLKKMAMASWPTSLSRWKHELRQAAERARNDGELRVHTWFEAHDPRAAKGSQSHIIELGAEIIPTSAGSVSYFFSVSQMDGQLRRGLRKINFDLDSTTSQQEPKPAMHSQISGRRPPSMAAHHHSDSFEHLDPKLDKPRIVCLPKSFALVTHMALLEYHSTDPALSRMVFDPTWVNVVRAAEERLLKPHFEFCLDWMSQSAYQKQSLLSRFYSLPR